MREAWPCWTTEPVSGAAWGCVWIIFFLTPCFWNLVVLQQRYQSLHPLNLDLILSYYYFIMHYPFFPNAKSMTWIIASMCSACFPSLVDWGKKISPGILNQTGSPCSVTLTFLVFLASWVCIPTVQLLKSTYLILCNDLTGISAIKRKFVLILFDLI